MTRKTVLRGLLDVPFDPLLLVWAAAVALSQWRTRIPGQRIVFVRGEQRSVSGVDAATQVRERLLLLLIVTLVAWLAPAVLRRSVRRWRGRRSEGEEFLFTAPFHRDPVFWFGVLAWVASITNGTEVLPHLQFRQSSAGIGMPLREVYDVDGGYGYTLALMVLITVLTVVPVGFALLARALYRRLGEPSRPRRRWRQTASS